MISVATAHPSITVRGVERPVVTVKNNASTIAINASGMRGPEGKTGPQGPVGAAGSIDADLPDFTLIFDNKLI